MLRWWLEQRPKKVKVKVKELALGLERTDIPSIGISPYSVLAMEAFLMCLRNIKDVSVVGMNKSRRDKD